MEKVIGYFIDNKHLNYAILVLLIFVGVSSYNLIPKEIFPDFALDKITVSGSYSGSSAANLDKMAVRDIEEGLSSINHIYKVETIIKSGSFSILLSISKGGNVSDILDKVKDEIAKITPNLPSDMNEPIAKQLERTREIVRLSISSNQLNFNQLIDSAREIKEHILKINKIAGVTIYGESDEIVEFKIDTQALKAYGINPSAITSAISSLSYTFPLGQIEQEGSFVFVSTTSGKASIKEWEETLIRVDGKSIYLSDISQIKKYRPQEATLSSFNTKNNIALLINKDVSGNSIKIKKQLDTLIDKIKDEYQNLNLILYQDSSKVVNARLSTIISNLTLGLILIFFTMYILINARTAAIVTIGVPFAFIIGIIVVYNLGYSLNMITLIGALLVVGIAVDDAVIVSENIQRHIEEGMPVREAAIVGTKEVALPITLATLTTVAAFGPIFMMSGDMGKFLLLIPVMVIAVLLGSLVESFLFLPLHATEVLKKESKTLDWRLITDWYERVLNRLIKYKGRYLIGFFIIVPLLLILSFKSMGFQFFLKIDVDSMKAAGKFPISTPIETTFKVAKEIEKELLSKKEQLFIKDISAVAGSRRLLTGGGESGTHVFELIIELEKREDENFINKYINPILDFSFIFNDPLEIRTKDAEYIGKQIEKIMHKYKKKYNLEEAYVRLDGPHLVPTDINIHLIGKDNEKLNMQVRDIQKRLQTIAGVKDIADNLSTGKQEYKININNYGELLGFSEKSVAQIISGYFLSNRSSTTYGKDGVVNIVTEDVNKDKIQTLKEFDIAIGDGRFVKLSDIVDFIIVEDYEKIEKENGSVIKYTTANVEKGTITASEVLDKIQPLLDEIKASGTEVSLKGEKEKNDEFKNDMKRASIVAMMSILILLLIIFPKIKYALMILSVIPFSMLGAVWGHMLIGYNLTMPSVIGMLGLAGVVINDSIIMLEFLHGTHDVKQFYYRAKLRVRPIFITTITTFTGLTTLMFFSTGQALMMAPIAISLGFGLVWGTVLNLFYLPTLYAWWNKIGVEVKTQEIKV